jgi:hypothetical protein
LLLIEIFFFRDDTLLDVINPFWKSSFKASFSTEATNHSGRAINFIHNNNILLFFKIFIESSNCRIPWTKCPRLVFRRTYLFGDNCDI